MKRLHPLLAAALLFNAAPAANEVLAPDPARDSPVPLSGAPLYVEALEVGGPLADFGSHLGLKASVLDKAGLPHDLFLSTVQYSALTNQAQPIDQTYVAFQVTTAAGTLLLFAPAESRRITFYPWGWKEEVEDRGWHALGSVTTLAHDTFRFDVDLHAPDGAPAVVAPRFSIAWAPSPTPEVLLADTPTLVAAPVGEGLDLKNALPSELIERVVQGATPLTAWIPGNGYGGTALFAPSSMPSTGALGWSVLVTGVDPKDGPAPQGPAFRLPWDGPGGFFDSLPPPHAERDTDRSLYRLAATALRMAVYGERSAMPATGVVPNKVHFSGFFGWDTPFHSIGISEFDPKLAADNLTLQFAAQTPAGEIYNAVGDDLSGNLFGMAGRSQPPVQPWAIRAVWDRAQGRLDPGWLRGLLDRSGRFMDWWFANRDTDGDGLPGYWSPLESGWDDTPRYPLFESDLSGLRGIRETRTLDAVDLDSWLYLGMREIARLWDEVSPSSATAEAWRIRARALAERVEDRLWDPGLGCWVDLDNAPEAAHHVLTRTPAMFFPLFAGMTVRSERARDCLLHLLSPAEFWGDPTLGRWPVPTVAFDDPAYNHRQQGYYWQGAVWLITNYTSITALFRYGFEEEARELRRRTLDLVAAADPGGIHETYDPLSGRIGWGSDDAVSHRIGGASGALGGGSAFQFGWSSVFVLELLLDRQEGERFLLPGETHASGFIGEVRTLPDDRAFYRFEGPGAFPPRVEMATSPPGRLPVRVDLTVTDPYGSLEGTPADLRFPALAPGRVHRVDGGSRAPVALLPGAGIGFEAVPGARYEITAGGVEGSGGCSSLGPSPAGGLLLLGILGVLILALRRRRALE